MIIALSVPSILMQLQPTYLGSIKTPAKSDLVMAWGVGKDSELLEIVSSASAAAFQQSLTKNLDPEYPPQEEEQANKPASERCTLERQAGSAAQS